jgi:hypothetical protein
MQHSRARRQAGCLCKNGGIAPSGSTPWCCLLFAPAFIPWRQPPLFLRQPHVVHLELLGAAAAVGVGCCVSRDVCDNTGLLLWVQAPAADTAPVKEKYIRARAVAVGGGGIRDMEGVREGLYGRRRERGRQHRRQLVPVEALRPSVQRDTPSAQRLRKHGRPRHRYRHRQVLKDARANCKRL